MSDIEARGYHQSASSPACLHAEGPVFRHVLACLDSSPVAQSVLAHAVAVATALDAHLTIMRVLEPSGGLPRTDPVEWTLRRHDAETELKERALRCGAPHADAVVIDGPAAERICAWVRENDVDLTVLGGRGEGTWPFGGIGGTARRVAESANGSVMLIRSTQAGQSPARYRKVMTPLDGSSWSECALPIALGIATACDAEILLVHAAPSIDLCETGPVECEAIQLRDKLRDRNRRVGEQYLKQVQSRLPRMQASSRTRVLLSGDARHALARAAMEDRSDIIVLSSTGHSGHSDLSVGSVADYLINHADMPVLLVRGRQRSSLPAGRRADESRIARMPSRALL
jgi:nucleotide-binding universal stress UspA family protein